MATKLRKAKKLLGEGYGGLDGGKCLESGTNRGRAADVWKIRQGSNVRQRMSEREDEQSSKLRWSCGPSLPKHLSDHQIVLCGDPVVYWKPCTDNCYAMVLYLFNKCFVLITRSFQMPCTGTGKYCQPFHFIKKY